MKERIDVGFKQGDQDRRECGDGLRDSRLSDGRINKPCDQGEEEEEEEVFSSISHAARRIWR